MKPSNTDFTPQSKRKRKGKIVKLAKTKKAMRELKKRVSFFVLKINHYKHFLGNKFMHNFIELEATLFY